MRSLTVEHAEDGVRVNAVAPGSIDSPMLAELSAEARDALVQIQGMKRLGDPSEVAEAVVWLTWARSSFVTGIAMPVDAGSSAF